ncbi:MAG: hypothetical protein PHS81_02535 [Candidatus Nanoarchaeia archaeon]|nr:hypothetical protein [Candidatus Nanoarchaeia archaeon]
MKKSLWIHALFLVIILSGCTSTETTARTEYDLESAVALNLSILVTDDLQIRRSTLFSGEMTKLTLNMINLAEVYFNDLRAILINADDLNPIAEYDYVEFIQPNRSNAFEWELTAPRLGVGEVLILNDIRARVYYETYSTALKTLLLRPPGNREYFITYSESSKSPIKLYFDTSYDSATTLPDNQLKNFTVNLVLYNEFVGIVDYYDNSYYSDNYIKSLVLAVPKELIFYNYADEFSPWKKFESNDSLEAERLNINPALLELYDYYYVEFKKIDAYSSQYDFEDLCSILLMTEQEIQNRNIDELRNIITQQRRVLWMTKGFTKINVLRFGAPTMEYDTEVNLMARIDYSYSQDFGGSGFGAVIYGLG